jgi:long-chain acyl-CoA synthetase
VALLVPRFANLERYAESRGIPFGSRAELLANPEIQALVQAEVDSVNRELAQYERIKRFAVLDREFSFDGGQLTYTQKVRRQEIEKEYHNLIEQLYQGEASAAS